MAPPQLGFLDLFGTPAPPVAQPVAQATKTAGASKPTVTPPTLPWARELTEAGVDGTTIWINVSLLNTGVVVESLSRGASSRQLLYADGRIEDIAPDPGQRGRRIFLGPDTAKALHAKHPLIRHGAFGTHSATYRFAAPGEQAPAKLWLPDGTKQEGNGT